MKQRHADVLAVFRGHSYRARHVVAEQIAMGMGHQHTLRGTRGSRRIHDAGNVFRRRCDQNLFSGSRLLREKFERHRFHAREQVRSLIWNVPSHIDDRPEIFVSTFHTVEGISQIVVEEDQARL